jgi:23S rRNA (guanosine2251-2'-O)-methyltransferase
MQKILVLENIRSAYNTWVMLRTCDALGRKAVLSWFTPRPDADEKVRKTALWAEQEVILQSFRNPKEARDRLREQGYVLVASEKTWTSSSVKEFIIDDQFPVAVVMGNENTGVLEETLQDVDHIVHIPMQGMKESLNVAEAAAIIMREIGKA